MSIPAQIALCKLCGAMHRLPRAVSTSQTACPKCGGKLKKLGNVKAGK